MSRNDDLEGGACALGLIFPLLGLLPSFPSFNTELSAILIKTY